MRNGLSSREVFSTVDNSASAPLLVSSSSLSLHVSHRPVVVVVHSPDRVHKREEEEQEEELFIEEDLDNEEEEEEDGDKCRSSGRSVVDLNKIAHQMNFNVEDVLRVLRSSRDSDLASESRTRLQHMTSSGLWPSGCGSNNSKSNNNNNNNCNNAARRNNSGSSDTAVYTENHDEGNNLGNESVVFAALRQHLSKEALSRTQLLSFAIEEDTTSNITNNAGGQEKKREHQTWEKPEMLDGFAAPIVFRSVPSTHGSDPHFSPIPSADSCMGLNPSSSLPFPLQQPQPRRIRFGSRIVTNVCVYSVNNEVYFGLQFRQHWSSWAALLCGFMLESIFEVHLQWFANVGSATTAKTIPVAHWVYTYRALFSAAYGVVWLICGGWRNGFNSFDTIRHEPRDVCLKSLAVTLLSAVCFSLATALMILTNEMAGSSLLFTATAMHCLWILLYRALHAQMVFFIETCGSLFLIVGNVLCNIDGMRLMGLRGTIEGNLVMTGGSLLYATAFLLMAYGLQRGFCGTAGLTVAVGIALFLITLVMGICSGYTISSSSSDGGGALNAGFRRANAMHSSLLAVEDLVFNLMYLYAFYHLDVLSVSACFSLKVAVVPVVAHFVVWRHAENVPPVERERWGPLLFVGVGVVAVAAAVVMFFASVRRRFIARRLFHMRGLRRVPDPYRKKRRGRHNKRRRSLTALS